MQDYKPLTNQDTVMAKIKKKTNKYKSLKRTVFHEGDTVLAKDGFHICNDKFVGITGQKMIGIVKHSIDMLVSGDKIYVIYAIPKRCDIISERRFFHYHEIASTRIVIVEKKMFDKNLRINNL